MKALKFSFIALLYLLLLVPVVQMTFQPFPKKKANGFHLPKTRPEPSYTSVLGGSFQEEAERWMMRRNGLWGAMIRLENELNVRLFRQISSSYASTAHVGKEGHFFQSLYLGSLNRTVVPAPEVMRRIAQNLRQLQDLLAKRGMPMILLISTNSVALHPEIVPEEYLDPGRDSRPNSYQLMIPLLEEYGVNFLDGHRFLVERKNSVPYKLFAPTASHWNDVATCWITDQLLDRLEGLLGKKLRRFACDTVVLRNAPRDYDADLLQIANIWDGKSAYRPTPYVKAQSLSTGDIYKPRLLFVGTSFLWSTLRYLDRYRTCRSNDFYFYFSKRRRWPQGTFRKIERSEVNWEKDIFSQDALILEINMAVLQNVGHGFIESAIRVLGGTPIEVNVGNALEQFLPQQGDKH